MLKPYKILVFMSLIFLFKLTSAQAMQKQPNIKQIEKIIPHFNCNSPDKLGESIAKIYQEQTRDKNLISLALIEALKRNKKSLLMCNKYKCTVLHFLCASNENELVHIVLAAAKKSGDQILSELLLAQEKAGSTALHWSSMPGASVLCIKENCQAAINCNDNFSTLRQLLTTTNSLGYNALHSACHMAYAECVEEFITAAMSINDDQETCKMMLSERSNRNNTPYKLILRRLKILEGKEASDENKILIQEAKTCRKIIEKYN